MCGGGGGGCTYYYVSRVLITNLRRTIVGSGGAHGGTHTSYSALLEPSHSHDIPGDIGNENVGLPLALPLEVRRVGYGKGFGELRDRRERGRD